MVLFQLPGAVGSDNQFVEMGLVVSVWRGIKVPKLYTGAVNVNSCVAFRVISLDMDPSKEESRNTNSYKFIDIHYTSLTLIGWITLIQACFRFWPLKLQTRTVGLSGNAYPLQHRGSCGLSLWSPSWMWRSAAWKRQDTRGNFVDISPRHIFLYRIKPAASCKP